MSEASAGSLVADYKRQLQAVCDKRPSGTRGRLAKALGTNRSFVSQLVNPVYTMPIPVQHLETIFEVCHFSQIERSAFLACYDRAHPGRRETTQPPARTRAITLTLPDLRPSAPEPGDRGDDRRLRAPVDQAGRNAGGLKPARQTAGRWEGSTMKKLMNSAETMLDESLDGFAAAHAGIVALAADRKFVRRRTLTPGKVALVSGGGSGHEPLHAGFVGQGMLDAACPGQVFTSPTPDQMVAAIDAADTGAGCLLIVKNYEGDVMNFEMAGEMASEGKNHDVATVITDDDVAVPNSTWSAGRRGVAGTLVVEKIVGAAAEQSMPLAGLQELGREMNARTRSMGIALTSCTVPAAGKPTFELGADEMEVGVGIHGEPGRRRSKLVSAAAIADEMLAAIVRDLDPVPGAEVLLLVNGFGGTPLMELYLMVDAARRNLIGRGLTVARYLTGSFVTSLDMAGCSFSVSVLDERVIRLWDAPVKTAALSW